MLVLSLVSWLLLGVAAAMIGKALAADHLGWFGLGAFGILGAVAGGIVGLGISDTFLAGAMGGAIGALAGVLIRGSAEEIRSRGPGLAV